MITRTDGWRMLYWAGLYTGGYVNTVGVTTRTENLFLTSGWRIILRMRITTCKHLEYLSIAGCTNWTITGHYVQDGYNLLIGDGRIMLVTEHQTKCSGQINTWGYWAQSTGTFKAMVARPDAVADDTKWTIVGVNDITVTSMMTNQRSSFTVPIADRISAQVNDVIALAVDPNNNPEIRRTISTSQELQNRFTNNYVGDHTVLVAGTVIIVDSESSYTPWFTAEICCSDWLIKGIKGHSQWFHEEGALIFFFFNFEHANKQISPQKM